MAIFTSGPDRKLPALTQFYQLSFSKRAQGEEEGKYGQRLLSTADGEELRLWVVRTAGLNEEESKGRIPSTFVTLSAELPLRDDQPFETSVFLGDSPKSGEGFLAEMAALHFFLVRLMDCAADGIAPQESEVEKLNELRAKYGPPRIAWHSNARYLPDVEALKAEASGGITQREVLITEDTLDTLYAQLKESPPFIGTAESLENRLGRLLVGEFCAALTRRQLTRCPICQSVFWKTNPKNIWCSRRCANRHTQRMWRSRKAEDNR